mgnify:CR=1 FL=1
MPVRFTETVAEHITARSVAGVFDPTAFDEKVIALSGELARHCAEAGITLG